MEFDGFDWDDGNVEKCQKHGVSVAEIESLFAGEPLVGPDPHQAEQRFRAAGRTAEGRALFVVFTLRVTEDEALLRPISARFMHRKEIETHDQKIPEV